MSPVLWRFPGWVLAAGSHRWEVTPCPGEAASLLAGRSRSFPTHPRGAGGSVGGSGVASDVIKAPCWVADGWVLQQLPGRF